MYEFLYYRRHNNRDVGGVVEFKTRSSLSSYIDMEQFAREIAYEDFDYYDWEDEDSFIISIFKDKDCKEKIGTFNIKVNKVNRFWATEIF